METASDVDVDSMTQDVIAKYQDYVNPTQVALLKVGGFDHIEQMAQGVTITDCDGNRYIDCLGGYGVFSVGHRHPRVIEAVKRHLDLMPLSSKTFLNKPMADLAAKLASIAPGNLRYTFFCNSGTEAVEAALKIARMATGRTDVIAAVDGYHGKTMGALSATGRDIYRTPFGPLLDGFAHVPWNDARAIEAALTDRTAAVILEPVQGEGGIKIPDPSYLKDARALCDRYGALLIVDEVQTGLGRTGRMFAVEHWGIEPDLMTLAKALGGGVMPIGAVMGTPDLWNRVFRENPFIHTSTFGGGEMACAAGLAAIEITLDEDLSARSAAHGAYFLQELIGLQHEFPRLIREARGLGLMIGLEFTESDIGKLVIGTMVHRGVVAAYTLNNPSVIRFEPPLIITREEIDYVVGVVRAAVQDAVDILGDLI